MPDCGAALVEALPEEAASPVGDAQEFRLVRLCVVESNIAATLLGNALWSQGIYSRQTSPEAWQISFWGKDAPVALEVRDCDLSRAQDILNTLRPPSPKVDSRPAVEGGLV